MRHLLFIAAILLTNEAFSAACCVGNGPRSFVQLKHLQKFDLGVASSFKDTYGEHNTYGEFENSPKNQALSLSLGMSGRIREDLELYFILPWVYQVKEFAHRNQGGGSLGDSVLGFRYVLWENLFEEDPYPKVTLIPNVKMPTGSMDSIDDDGNFSPGTGNGSWEPGLAVQVQKDFGFAIFSLTPSYTKRLARNIVQPGTGSARTVNMKEGDRIEIGGSATVPVSQRLSLIGGGNSAWELAREVESRTISDSEARTASVFGSVQYHFTRFWLAGVTYESTLPFERLGRNLPTTRIVTLTTTYAIY
jgi:hypothetical protein